MLSEKDELYCYIAEQEVGPFTMDALRIMLRSGEVGPKLLLNCNNTPYLAWKLLGLPNPDRDFGQWLRRLVIPVVAAVFVGIVLTFATFVWPTRWEHDRSPLSDGRSYPVRICRFTGRVEYLVLGSWRVIGGPSQP
jgi:hypothetical protein